MSIAFLTASNDKLLVDTSLNLAPSGREVFLGILPFLVSSTVMKGFGLASEICLTVKSSLSLISQTKKPLSFVSPWFC